MLASDSAGNGVGPFGRHRCSWCLCTAAQRALAGRRRDVAGFHRRRAGCRRPAGAGAGIGVPSTGAAGCYATGVAGRAFRDAAPSRAWRLGGTQLGAGANPRRRRENSVEGGARTPSAWTRWTRPCRAGGSRHRACAGYAVKLLRPSYGGLPRERLGGTSRQPGGCRSPPFEAVPAEPRGRGDIADGGTVPSALPP